MILAYVVTSLVSPKNLTNGLKVLKLKTVKVIEDNVVVLAFSENLVDQCS